MGEERRREVGSQLAQIPADKSEVVVVHDNGCARRRLLGDGVCKSLVEQAVPFPGFPPDAVESWPAGVVEKAVVQKPQRAVRDHVISRPRDLGPDGDHAQL